MPSEVISRARPTPSRRSAAMLLCAFSAALPAGGAAQDTSLVLDSLVTTSHRVEHVPFDPGEELRFNMRASVFGGGEAFMTVGQIDTLHGFTAYPVALRMKGSALGIGFEQTLSSWMDTETLVSRRFINDQLQPRKRYREHDFYPEKRLVQRIDYDTTWALPTALPLDDISFVYFARTIPLEVGETYTFHRYYKDDGNPVILKVLRRERTEVPAGVFNTIVVQPIIRTSGLFSEGGEAEIHFSDDERRLVVYLRADMGTLLPTLELKLEEIGTVAPEDAGVGDAAGATAHGFQPGAPN